MISKRTKEYLTVGRTLEELRQQEPEMRAAGVRKRRNGQGKAATVTKEFFQWWDRITKTNANNWPQRTRQIKLRAEHRCIICGQPATPSPRTKDGFSQYCARHLIAQRERGRKYHGSKVRYLSSFSYRLEPQ